MEKSAWYIKLIKQLLLLLTFFYIQSCEQTPEEKTSPNVLMISIDDLNDWIGVLGVHPDIKTPIWIDLPMKHFVYQRPLSGSFTALTGLSFIGIKTFYFGSLWPDKR